MNLFEYFTTDNISGKKCTEKWLSKNNLELFNQIIDWCDRNSLKDLEFKRKVFHYVTDSTEIPVCLNCSREVKYRRLRDGYQPYCSSLCQNSCSIAKDNWLQSWKKGNSNNEHIVSRNKTVLEKYGNIEEYNKHIQNSIKETCLEKYGVEYATQTDFYKEKRKETLLEKYGSEKYNNSDKTRNTRIKNGTQINDEIIDGFLEYKKVVINRTITIYRNNQHIINPENLKRSKKSHHIDHLFSIKQGFLINLPVEVISHPCNLHMIYYKENLVKQDNCWITLSELLEKIISYEIELNFTHNHLKNKYSKIKEISECLLKEIK
jgi:hypothetical protein